MTIYKQTIEQLSAGEPLPVRPLTAEELHKGLLLRSPNWLGDAVMTLPAVKQLAILCRSAKGELSVTGPAALKELYLGTGLVKRYFAINELHSSWSKELRHEIENRHFHQALLFNNSLRDCLMLKMCGIPHLYGVTKRCRGVFLTAKYRFPAIHRGVLNSPHQALRYLEMAYALGAPQWDGVMPAITANLSREQLKPAITALAEHPNVLLLAPGGAYGAAKRWMSEHYRSVAEYQLKHDGLVAVLGGANEKPQAQEIVAGLPENRAFDLTGQTNFSELLFLFNHSHFMVANDSGLMHLAAAVGLPGIAVFGSTDYILTGPVGNNWTVLFDKQECAPCFRRVCPSGTRACLQAISPELVISEMNEIKKSAGRREN